MSCFDQKIIHEISQSQRYWARAKEYFDCAEALTNGVGNLYAPIMTLYATTIELALKAYILNAERSVDSLNPFRHHDILKLYNKAFDLGLKIDFNPDDFRGFKKINVFYLGGQLRYPQLGSRVTPNQFLAEKIARIFLDSVFERMESIIKCNTQPVRYRDGQVLRTTDG